jgi:hypothetical protein
VVALVGAIRIEPTYVAGKTLVSGGFSHDAGVARFERRLR